MIRREAATTDGTTSSIGPVHFFAKGVLISNGTTVDAIAVDDSGNEYDAPARVAVTWPLAIPTSRINIKTVAPAPPTDDGALVVTLTDAETILSTAQLATIQLGGNLANAKTAATIVALGAGSDGELAMLRIGAAAPFDYVPIIFDGTAGEWVSPEFPVYPQQGAWNSTDGITQELRVVFGAAGTIEAAMSHVRAKPLTDAGLKLELRMIGEIQGSASAGFFTTQTFPRIYETNIGDSVVTQLANVGGGANISGNANNTWFYFDGGWNRVNVAATKDIWQIAIMLDTGGAQTLRLVASMRGRWVG